MSEAADPVPIGRVPVDRVPIDPVPIDRVPIDPVTRLAILYRGPLASCVHDCPYCPFAKRADPPTALREDRRALARFVDWARTAPVVELSVLFTPWGEALNRRWYREALVELSRLPHVRRAAIQTSLPGRVDWVREADPSRLALWCTYHPDQVDARRFAERCVALAGHGVRFSVGVVALPEHLGPARRMRELLPDGVYLWANAADGHVYPPAEEEAWTHLDPLFGFSVRSHDSLGVDCRAGREAVSVDGEGTVRRCHFVPEPIGNLYDGSWRAGLRHRPCPQRVCDCHIGYVHLPTLPLDRVFGDGLLERVPVDPQDPGSAEALRG